MEAFPGIQVLVLFKPLQERDIKGMVNTKKLLRLRATARSKVNRLVGPPWRVGADGQRCWYSQENVVWQHMRLVKQELLLGNSVRLSGFNQCGLLTMPVDVDERGFASFAEDTLVIIVSLKSAFNSLIYR